MNFVIDVPLAEHRKMGYPLAVYAEGYTKTRAEPLYHARDVECALTWINERREENRVPEEVTRAKRKETIARRREKRDAA